MRVSCVHIERVNPKETMPNLNPKEISDFNAIKDELKSLWDGCNIISESTLFLPKGKDGKRVDLIEHISSIFDKKTTDNLLKIQQLAYTITEKLLNSNNSETTKLKKLTIYRKMVAELIGLPYGKNDYNCLPFALFAFSNNGELSGKLNLQYTRKTQQNNEAENRIPMSLNILNQLINQAVNDLRNIPDTGKDYGSKMIAIELLTGRRQFEEILNNDCELKFKTNGFFTAKNLAKASEDKKKKLFTLPYLGKNLERYDGEISDLLIKNLEIVRNYADKKSGLKSPLPILLNRIIVQATTPYDDILKPIRLISNLEMIDGKSHFFRKLYAFSCYAFFDGCQSNEAQYFAQVLAEGNLASDNELSLNLITAKSYSIFKLVSNL